MKQIKCPHCGGIFTIDEADYNSIVAQIKDHAFEEELERRETQIKDSLEAKNKLDANKVEASYKEQLDRKQKELDDLQHRYELAEADYKAKAKANEETLNSAVNAARMESKQAMSDQLHEAELKIASLQKDLETQKQNANAALESELIKHDLVNEKKINEMQTAINEEKQKAFVEAETLRIKYEEELKGKDKEIEDQKALVEQYKDFKIRQSTKMIGESLEQHCSVEFNRNRMGMFPRAYFEKDNAVSESGSKGDFIFRDYDEDGTEIVSIMFEMKNENETTASKHKNEDFFKELDKDRREKNCEYAVLCTMLEADNELYNEGIVDVSYRYPKMYVIRPQFFIPIITLIRNASVNALEYKKQLALEKANNIDLTNFEDNMNKFKDAFGKNYATASKKFADAIDEIDKSIAHLNKIKEALTSSDRQLRLANDKAQDLTIRKLTRNAPSVKDKLDEVREQKVQAHQIAE